MWNIMRALNYQTKRDNVIIIGFCFAFFLQIVAFLGNGSAEPGEWNGCSVVVLCSEIYPILIGLLPLVITCRICGWDFDDKTINYELLSGHSRYSVFWARVTVSFLWSIVGTAAVIFLPIMGITIAGGWGYGLNAADMALRGLISFFPMFRIICVWILMTTLLRSSYKTLLLGYLLFDGTALITVIAEESQKAIHFSVFSLANLMKLLNLSNYTMVYINGEDVAVYRTALETSEIYSSIFVSLAVGTVCLALSCGVFYRRDMS